MLSGSCFKQAEGYAVWSWLLWGQPGLYVPAMLSRVRGALPDGADEGPVKVTPALEKLEFEEETARSEPSPKEWSWSKEGPAKELSDSWTLSDLGFLAACVAYRQEKKGGWVTGCTMWFCSSVDGCQTSVIFKFSVLSQNIEIV